MTRVSLAAKDTFRSLRMRNFRLFFLGQLVSQTGTWLTMVAQTLLVLRLTDSGIALGLLAACQFGPVLVLGAWAGTVADRSDKRRLLIIAQTAAMAQSFALAAVVFSHQDTVGVIYALAAVQGVITAFDNPARRAFVVEMVPREDVPNAVSLNSAIMTGARVFGPALAGLLVITVGFGWAFLLDAVSYAAVIYGLWAMRTKELFAEPPSARSKGQVREGLRYVFAEPQLLVPLVMMAVVGTFAFNFSVTIPLLVKRTLGGDDAAFTLLFSVLSLGSLIGALTTARRSTVTSRNLIASSAGFGVAMLGLAAVPNLWAAFPVGIALGYASVGFLTSSTSIVQLLAHPMYRGRVLALQAMVFLGSTPIGGPIVGWVSDVGGPRAGMVLGGVACLAAALYGFRGAQGRRTDAAPRRGPDRRTGARRGRGPRGLNTACGTRDRVGSAAAPHPPPLPRRRRELHSPTTPTDARRRLRCPDPRLVRSRATTCRGPSRPRCSAACRPGSCRSCSPRRWTGSGTRATTPARRRPRRRPAPGRSCPPSSGSRLGDLHRRRRRRVRLTTEP